VVTIEGLALEMGGELLQSIVEQHGAVQCGFCSAGMLLSVWSAVSDNPEITEQQLKEALVGNLCRCGTHPRILEAAAAFRESLKQSAVGNKTLQQEAR
jgi:aerobic-type carbon monoxide dehydrogenase small subunit (CoxS/CutS family)